MSSALAADGACTVASAKRVNTESRQPFQANRILQHGPDKRKTFGRLRSRATKTALTNGRYRCAQTPVYRVRPYIAETEVLPVVLRESHDCMSCRGL